MQHLHLHLLLLGSPMRRTLLGALLGALLGTFAYEILSRRGFFLRSIAVVEFIPFFLFLFLLLFLLQLFHRGEHRRRKEFLGNSFRFVLIFLEEIDGILVIELIVIVGFELQVVESVYFERISGTAFVVVQIYQRLNQGGVILLNRLVSISDELRILVFILVRLCLAGKPSLFLLVGVKILSIPAILDLGNIGRFPLS